MCILINILKRFKSIYLLIILFFGCFSQTVFSQLPTYLPSDSLVGWWPFNGNANDESGNGNNGTVNGASLTEDRFGNASTSYRFGGLNQYIVLGTNGLDSLPVDFTLSTWVFTDSLYYGNNGATSAIVTRRHVDGVGGPSWSTLYVDSTENAVFAVDGPGYINNIKGNLNINSNWTHLVGVKQGNFYALYANGILLKDTVDNYIHSGSIMDLHVGHHGAWNTYFYGVIDDIAIWNRALSTSEVYNLYQANCTFSATIQPPPAVTGCEGDTVPLSANANSSCQYQWYKDGQILPSATDSTLLASGSGWYTVKAISSFCESKDSVQIIQFPLPEVNAGSDQTLCAGSSIILNGSGATTYSWNNGVQDGIAFVPNGNMNYVLTGTDSNGCIASDIVNVTVLGANATFMVQLDAVGNQCNGVAAVNMYYDGSFLYNWSNGYQSTGMVGMVDSCYLLCTGPISVIVSDNTNNCEFSFSGVVGNNSPGENPLAGYINLINTDGNTPCNGVANVIAYGGFPPYQYQFMDVNGIISGSSNNADSLCPGVYTFKIFDSQQDSLNISFLICDSSSIFSIVNPAYQDSVILDTLVVSLIENCEIDFASVDSVWISSYSYLGTDSLMVSWNIQDSAGIHEILNYYNLSNCQGVFNLELSIFCPQKSTDNPYLKAYDQLYINAQTASINSTSQEVFKVWPNPFTNELFVELTSNEVKDYFIMDAFGRVVVKGILSPAEHQLDLHNLMSGIYFLCVGQKKIKVEKLLTSQH
jgi:hypothetical protein